MKAVHYVCFISSNNLICIYMQAVYHTYLNSQINFLKVACLTNLRKRSRANSNIVTLLSKYYNNNMIQEKKEV